MRIDTASLQPGSEDEEVYVRGNSVNIDNFLRKRRVFKNSRGDSVESSHEIISTDKRVLKADYFMRSDDVFQKLDVEDPEVGIYRVFTKEIASAR